MNKAYLLLVLAFIIILSACSNDANRPAADHADSENHNGAVMTPTPSPEPAQPDQQNEEDVDADNQQAEQTPDSSQPEPSTEPSKPEEQPEAGAGNAGSGDEAVEVVANPEAVAVLVNKKYSLPKDYEPADLTEPNVPFIFKEKSQKRMMRKEAAEALEALFAGAKADGIGLAGVSGYRSYATQKALFARYVARDGEAAAARYSARPGHSEHSTGLAMDVTGSDGKCAAEDCFGKTEAAKWLAEHADEYGFIIRYPDGKEEITGYKYEPWHLRYVGVEIAAEIADKGITLEEYYGQDGDADQPKNA